MNKVLQQIDQSQEEMLMFLERIVNIDSATDYPEGSEQCAKVIGEKLKELGFEVEYIDSPSVCTHVIGRRRGSGKKHIMLTGHIDTAFAHGTAAARPFFTKDGRAYGPGVADMKGGIAMGLFVLQALYKSGWDDKSVTVMFCGDEETGHAKTNAAELFAREGRGKDAVFSLEPGRPNGGVVIGRKGVMIPEIFIKGRAAHACYAEKGVSAVHEMAHKIMSICQLQDLDKGIMCNVGSASGGMAGVAGSTVADEAYLRFSVRFDTFEDGKRLQRQLEDIASNCYVPGTTSKLVDNKFLYLPLETTDEIQQMYAIVKKNADFLGIKNIEGLFQPGGSDACWTAIVGAPTICGMGPVGDGFHQEGEFISLVQLMERAKLLGLCIQSV